MTIPAIPGFIGAPTVPPQSARVVTPQGSDQSDGGGLTYGLNLIDVTVHAGVVVLPTAVAGASVALANGTTNGGSVTWNPLVFAQAGSDTINGQVNATAFDLAGSFNLFACVEDGAWLGTGVPD